MFRIILVVFLLLGALLGTASIASNLPSAAQVERDSRAAVKNGSAAKIWPIWPNKPSS